ncbi:MAG: glycosyl transferase [Noviherbaspirillum sp.]|jgi:glycosyltransferase involved in cell wall biosynthesis|nr:glycosyl transferase [Noviherbaspirillum sp.]MDB5795820.1 glycosyl transferase [Noviherbaspirillum sp.]
MHIVHLSSAHSRSDMRIFHKQCRSLASRGHEVTLVVADGKGDGKHDGIAVLDVGKPEGRLDRMWRATRRIGERAIALDAAVYHLHDPELIPLGLRLRRLRKKVVFDSHEDVPKQIRAKTYLGPIAKRVLPGALAFVERYACRRFSGIVAATPCIRDKFLSINRYTVDVNNFPMMGELDIRMAWSDKQDEVCYIGGISAVRGIREMVLACEKVRTAARINVAGNFTEPGLEREVKSLRGWDRVNELGYLGRAGVREVLKRSVAGLVTLHPSLNHLESLPVKMFEYMAAGIPVIASDFPLWREILERHRCGVCVDPSDPAAIAAAIDYFVLNPGAARRMGANGRRAVLEKYNWSIEEKKLCDFYTELA